MSDLPFCCVGLALRAVVQGIFNARKSYDIWCSPRIQQWERAQQNDRKQTATDSGNVQAVLIECQTGVVIAKKSNDLLLVCGFSGSNLLFSFRDSFSQESVVLSFLFFLSLEPALLERKQMTATLQALWRHQSLDLRTAEGGLATRKRSSANLAHTP